MHNTKAWNIYERICSKWEKKPSLIELTMQMRFETASVEGETEPNISI